MPARATATAVGATAPGAATGAHADTEVAMRLSSIPFAALCTLLARPSAAAAQRGDWNSIAAAVRATATGRIAADPGRQRRRLRAVPTGPLIRRGARLAAAAAATTMRACASAPTRLNRT
ncbi:hypothetical protein [Xanthomonas theicola]|uniref:hypothetical protein n=1 Tax=Xanthomonas theicola TaxID=56464 RepID=UPI000FF89F96|nr:hypothetical protein [Xanthomonas theicola]QNH26820.1 hypothetical protein G4Q83_21795 [Xanthomonas theicola]